MTAGTLLDEFPPVGTAAWEAAIAADLKGASYQEKLIWRAPQGVTVRPYYRAEDLAGLGWLDAPPGAFPFVRGARAEGGWRIREEIAAADAAEANRAALSAAAGGAEEIAFRGVSIGDVSRLALLLANLGEIPVHFDSADEPILRALLEFVRSGSRSAPVSADFDPQAGPDFAAAVLAAAPDGFAPFAIDGLRRAPAGANPVEQTAWALAAGVQFLRAMQERNIAADRAAAAVEFNFALGANYFFEIARLRAFRMLWARVVECFGGLRASARARIAARTAYPPAAPDKSHWNILRATTEAMSAILGGADSICIAPFEEGGEAGNQAGRRLARNVQLLLKQESFFTRVADPGGGSYYLETLTDSIACDVWKIMQGIEARGGPQANSEEHRQEGAGLLQPEAGN